MQVSKLCLITKLGDAQSTGILNRHIPSKVDA